MDANPYRTPTFPSRLRESRLGRRISRAFVASGVVSLLAGLLVIGCVWYPILSPLGTPGQPLTSQEAARTISEEIPVLLTGVVLSLAGIGVIISTSCVALVAWLRSRRSTTPGPSP